jgi:hypothetical protein
MVGDQSPVEPEGDLKSSPSAPSGGFSIRTIAGAAAFFLGLVYAYGAVIKAGELHDAGQAIGDTLPLVPLEQILVLGINQLLPVAVSIGVILLCGMAWFGRTRKSEDEEEGDPDPEAEDDAEDDAGTGNSGWLFWVIVIPVYVYLFVAVSWTTWLLLAEIIAVSWYARTNDATVQRYAVFASVAIAVFFTALAWFDPSPLAHVRIKTSDGRVITGSLVATTGTTWYVGTSDKHWTAVQASEIGRVQVSAVKKETKESIYYAITGHRLFGLGPK